MIHERHCGKITKISEKMLYMYIFCKRPLKVQENIQLNFLLPHESHTRNVQNTMKIPAYCSKQFADGSYLIFCNNIITIDFSTTTNLRQERSV